MEHIQIFDLTKKFRFFQFFANSYFFPRQKCNEMTTKHGSSSLVLVTNSGIFFRAFVCSNLGKNNICFFLLTIFTFFEKNNFSIENFISAKGWWILHFWKHSGLDIRFWKAAMFLDFLILRFLCKIKIFSGPDFSIFQNALWNKMGCSGPLKPTLKCFQWHESV